MKTYESAHYIFHYGEGGPAERDILDIAAYQESCFEHITYVLGITPDFKIHYYLCDSPEEVGRVYGDNEPCNAFAAMPDAVYAVYNDEVKCIGFHEDAHIISYLVKRPTSPAVREGIAMYFDRKWWGIQNLDWTSFFLKSGRYVPVDRLLNKEDFCQHDCTISYPIVGAFTEWLIARYGMERYLEFYRINDAVEAMIAVFGKTPRELNLEFEGYVKLFSVDEMLLVRMENLINM